MAIDFPANPVDGEIFTAGENIYQWTGYAWSTKGLSKSEGAVPIAGGVMTGPLILSGQPIQDLQAAPKVYVDQQVAGNQGANVAIAGDTMTGPLILSEEPSAVAPPLQAATKSYVDGKVGLPPLNTGVPGNALTINIAGNPVWGGTINCDNY